ncbi:MAG: SEL1-like repeat protein [Kiritimatiellae bacterium]|nr:SEL1-like repeat protein [Kiritimatiellia bacterium]
MVCLLLGLLVSSAPSCRRPGQAELESTSGSPQTDLRPIEVVAEPAAPIRPSGPEPPFTHGELLDLAGQSLHAVAADFEMRCPPICVGHTTIVRRATGSYVEGIIKSLTPKAVVVVRADDSERRVPYDELDFCTRYSADRSFRALWVRLESLVLARNAVRDDGHQIEPVEFSTNDFETAVSVADPAGLNAAASALLRARGRDRDMARTMLYFYASALQGNPEGEYYYGYMHYRGLAVQADASLALQWIARAASQGFTLAQVFLEKEKVSAEDAARALAKWEAATSADRRAQAERLRKLVAVAAAPPSEHTPAPGRRVRYTWNGHTYVRRDA